MNMNTLHSGVTAQRAICTFSLVSRKPVVFRGRMGSHGEAAATAPTSAAAPATYAVAKSSIEDHSAWEEYHQRWFSIWQEGLPPGQLFDKGACSPKLLQLISSSQLDLKGKRAFVPGCGRGYDVFAFALAGAEASVGLDICPTAIAAAATAQDKELASQPDAAERCELVVGDFFSYRHPSGKLFDVGYDYTFLCALRPDMRRDWAQGWSRLLAPGGTLITMIYPVDPSMDASTGPPWPVTPQLYQDLLPAAGFELALLEQIPSSLSHPSREGREWLGIWRRTSEQQQQQQQQQH